MIGYTKVARKLPAVFEPAGEQVWEMERRRRGGHSMAQGASQEGDIGSSLDHLIKTIHLQYHDLSSSVLRPFLQDVRTFFAGSGDSA